MSGSDALQSVQFVTLNEKRFALIDGDDWESFVDWFEDLEDRQAVAKALEELRAVGGDRERAGWLKWQGPVREFE